MNCHPDRSEAKWRDLRFGQSASKADGSVALPFVNPERSGEPALSEVEWGSAVFSPDNKSTWKRRPFLCHPDRSAAEWRDLRFGQSASKADGSVALPFVIPSVPEFPATRHWIRQRVRLSVKKGAGISRNPLSSTGNPSEAEGSAVPRTFMEMFFDVAQPRACPERSRMGICLSTTSTQNPRGELND
jgi:hypothetical protein